MKKTGKIIVRAYFDDGDEKAKEFDNMTDAIAFQEKLVFEYGVDAEID